MNCQECLCSRHGDCWHPDLPDIDDAGTCQNQYNILVAASIVALEYEMGVRE